MAPPSKAAATFLGAVFASSTHSAVGFGEVPSATKQCIGTTPLHGFGQASLIGAYWDTPGNRAGHVHVENDVVVAGMKGRAYFGMECSGPGYLNEEYLALRLLGKRLKYRTNISGAECGCNAALYLTSLRQNSDPSSCSDHYCDAANVCGVTCAEIDLQEANMFSYYTTLHTEVDQPGVGEGYGAWRRTWHPSEYGPGARCIDTKKPFDVEASFPIDAEGVLKAIKLKLSQEGSPCRPLEANMNQQTYNNDEWSWRQLSKALDEGMTPIVSYWGAGADMSWMDGPGIGGVGPCAEDHPDTCGPYATFSNFAVEVIGAGDNVIFGNPADLLAHMRDLKDGGADAAIVEVPAVTTTVTTTPAPTTTITTTTVTPAPATTTTAAPSPAVPTADSTTKSSELQWNQASLGKSFYLFDSSSSSPTTASTTASATLRSAEESWAFLGSAVPFGSATPAPAPVFAAPSTTAAAAAATVITDDDAVSTTVRATLPPLDPAAQAFLTTAAPAKGSATASKDSSRSAMAWGRLTGGFHFFDPFGTHGEGEGEGVQEEPIRVLASGGAGSHVSTGGASSSPSSSASSAKTSSGVQLLANSGSRGVLFTIGFFVVLLVGGLLLDHRCPKKTRSASASSESTAPLPMTDDAQYVPIEGDAADAEQQVHEVEDPRVVRTEVAVE